MTQQKEELFQGELNILNKLYNIIMENIDKLAVEFLNQDNIKEAGSKNRKSRNVIRKNYENIRKRYTDAKHEVEDIVAESEKLKKKYEKAVAKMESYYEDMMKIRNHMHKMDDEGLEYLDLKESETPVDFDDNEDEAEAEAGAPYDPYSSFRP